MERIPLYREHRSFCGATSLTLNGKRILDRGLIPQAHLYGYTCPNCGAEHYAGCYCWSETMSSQKMHIEWDYSYDEIRERLQAINERDAQFLTVHEDFLSSHPCKVCGEPLSISTGYFCHLSFESEDGPSVRRFNDTDSCFDPLFSLMKKEREGLLLESAQKEYDVFLEKVINDNRIQDDLSFNEEKALSCKWLAQYLQHLLQLEANEYTIRQHLIFLFKEEKKIKLQILDENQIESQPLFWDVVLPAWWKVLDIEEPNYKNIIKSPVKHPAAPIMPNKPTQNFNKPLEPIYEKPGLFNKKRVLAENEAKRGEYKKELEIYENLKRELINKEEAYKIALNKYNVDKAKYDEECCAREQVAQQEHEKKIEASKAQYLKNKAEATEKYEAEKRKIHERFALKHKTELYAYLEKEIDRCKELLSKTIKAKNELYSKNIIYAKYRNMIAVSCFYEYFMAGRVSTLSGTDGAYNLYETETRSNLIITKLSDVVDSLEAIKENQIALYRTMNNIDHNIKELNMSIGEVINALKQLNENTESITELLESIDNSSAANAKNTSVIARDTQIIAHHSEVTAYYTKKNAEIADAIGFMVALK